MKTILVIEDDPEVRQVIELTLRVNDFEVLTAADGLSGIQLAQKHLPDLIVCDVRMPNLDGYDTLAALRHDPATALIPFVFLTGATDRREMRRGMELGADDYVTKPFHGKELLAAVTARLEKQEAVQRSSEKKLEQLSGNICMMLPHELRTPLAGILGLASILKKSSVSLSQREIAEYAQNIYDSGSRLNRLIENFLVYSQIELSAADPARKAAFGQTDPAPVADLLAKLARQKAQKANREPDLSLHIEAQSAPVAADHLRKIAEELVDNAFKFSQPGSPVRVATRQEAGAFVLSVSDRGRGLTAEQIASVGAHMQFERKFFEQQGSGLGLIIAKRLSELLGGVLTIDSIPGHGTTVEAALPALQQP